MSTVNQRRIELIGKSRSLGLSVEEAKELDQLQDAVDQRLEPMDRQLLAVAEHFRLLAEELPDEPNP
jgi:DNA-binding transcriptional MerR regulator